MRALVAGQHGCPGHSRTKILWRGIPLRTLTIIGMVHGRVPAGETARRHGGLWWQDWAAWADARADRIGPPPPMGSERHRALGEAPGGYIRGWPSALDGPQLADRL